MNPKLTSVLSTSFTALFALPAFALEAPEDNSPPPMAARKQVSLPQIKLPQTQPKSAPAPQASTAFLGVVTGDLPPILREHLSLKPNEGIIVHSLIPDGPAAKAGLAVNDVITKVAGKSIGSPSELRQQIAERRIGDTVSMEFIHKGISTQQDLILTARPATVAESNEPQILDPQQLQGLPDDLADRIRNAISGNVGGLDLQLGKIKDADVDHLHGAIRDLFDRQAQNLRQGGLVLPGDDASGKVQLQSGATVKVQDKQGSLEVHTNDGDKQVTLRDPQNQITWTGPWNNEKDQAAAPESVRQRMKLLNLDTQFEGSGLRFKMQP
jgi:serine protease Do